LVAALDDSAPPAAGDPALPPPSRAAVDPTARAAAATVASPAGGIERWATTYRRALDRFRRAR
jgi:hypothetical protein